MNSVIAIGKFFSAFLCLSLEEQSTCWLRSKLLLKLANSFEVLILWVHDEYGMMLFQHVLGSHRCCVLNAMREKDKSKKSKKGILATDTGINRRNKQT